MLVKLVYVVLLLGVLVFVHELGHFLLAKACKVKVLRFSIGFGPRVVGFQRGETEYRISWIPLGGYVKMAGDTPYEELPPDEARRGFLAQPPWKRGLIVAAGPAFNLLFPVLVYFMVYWGAHEVISSRIGSVEPGLPAAAAKLQPGDRILAVDAERVETFEELRDALQDRYDREVTLTVERDQKQFSATLTPARMLETGLVRTAPRGMVGITPYARPAIAGVPAGSVAEAAGLKTFDRILRVNGQVVKDEVAFQRVLGDASGTLELLVQRNQPLELPGLGGQAPPSLMTLRLERQPGEGYQALGAESVDLYVAKVASGSPADQAGIKPGDRLVSINGKPLESFQLVLMRLKEIGDQPFQLRWRSGTQEREQELRQAQAQVGPDELPRGPELGVLPYPLRLDASSAETIIKHLNARQALAASLRVVPEAIAQTAVLIGRLFTGAVPLSSVGGPLMIAQLASESAEQGLDSFLRLMALISINLGLVNLLPIPILDGFHLFASLWEGVRRRPIQARTREIANWIGLAMLMLLMAIAFRNDLARLFDRWW